MEKRITYQQFQSAKSVAKAIDPLQRKIEPLKEKIKAMVEECKGYQEQVSALEAGIVNILGFHVTDLVKKVIEPTGAVDPKTGKPIKVTKYVPTDIVSYDEQHKQYVISIPDAPSVVEENEVTNNEMDSEMPQEDVENAETPSSINFLG